MVPHFDCCSVVWHGLSQQLSEKLHYNYKIALPELLLNLVRMQTLAIFSTLSAGIACQSEGKFNVQMRQ